MPRRTDQPLDARDQLSGRNVEGCSQAQDGAQRRIHLSALQHADVGPVVSTLEAKALLRYVPVSPHSLKRFGKRQLGSDTGTFFAASRHSQFDIDVLQSIVLQSIL